MKFRNALEIRIWSMEPEVKDAVLAELRKRWDKAEEAIAAGRYLPVWAGLFKDYFTMGMSISIFHFRVLCLVLCLVRVGQTIDQSQSSKNCRIQELENLVLSKLLVIMGSPLGLVGRSFT